jgi:hypothetical protein
MKNIWRRDDTKHFKSFAVRFAESLTAFRADYGPPRRGACVFASGARHPSPLPGSITAGEVRHVPRSSRQPAAVLSAVPSHMDSSRGGRPAGLHFHERQVMHHVIAIDPAGPGRYDAYADDWRTRQRRS